MWKAAGMAIILALVVSCTTGETGGAEGAGAVTPGQALSAALRTGTEEFRLSERREVKVVYSLFNTSRRVLRLDFPSAQHLEVTMRGPGGERLFLWSEDRSFATAASSVVVNPGERLEYEANVPTRDMVAGQTYEVEAVLPGYPETSAQVLLRPR